MLHIVVPIRFFGHLDCVSHIFERLPRVHSWIRLIICPYIFYRVDLLVTSLGDAAGVNMATHLGGGSAPTKTPSKFEGFDIMGIDGPSIEADSIEDGLGGRYDGIVFLSRHAASSGKLALTCHSTGSFSSKCAGGRVPGVAVPHAQIIKRHIRMLWERRSEFGGFDITLEATHHGPTSLRTPSAFVEVGTSEMQWNDTALCARVADALRSALEPSKPSPTAVCFGGNHYPSKFTNEAIFGEFAVGTIVPKHALVYVDAKMISHILEQNPGAQTALIDPSGMGPHKSRILELLEGSDLEVVRL